MDFGFILKKLVGVLFMPLPIITICLIIGVVYISLQNYKSAKNWVLGSVSLLYLTSIPITSSLLLAPFEYSIAKLNVNEVAQAESSKIEYIWMLGCFHSNDERLPLSAKIHQCSLPRLVQGTQFSLVFPNAKLILTGMKSDNQAQSHPYVSKALLEAIGVEPSKIIVFDDLKDTEEEIQYLKNMLGNKSIIAISSATHMKRIKFLSEKYGLNVILSPAEYASSKGELTFGSFIPSANSLRATERAMYEFMGNIWIRIKFIFN